MNDQITSFWLTSADMWNSLQKHGWLHEETPRCWCVGQFCLSSFSIWEHNGCTQLQAGTKSRVWLFLHYVMFVELSPNEFSLLWWSTSYIEKTLSMLLSSFSSSWGESSTLRVKKFPLLHTTWHVWSHLTTVFTFHVINIVIACCTHMQ